MTIVYVPEDLELGEWGSLGEALGCKRRSHGGPGQGLTLPVSPGQHAFQLEATDIDGDKLTYSISETFYFSVQADTGNVTLRNSLDREVRVEIGADVPAQGGGPAVTQTEGRAVSPGGELLPVVLWDRSLAPKPISVWERRLGGASHPWVVGGRLLGLSHPRIELSLALTKFCLLSPQTMPRLTMVVKVFDGINEPVSAGAWAGWLQWVMGRGSRS